MTDVPKNPPAPPPGQTAAGQPLVPTNYYPGQEWQMMDRQADGRPYWPETPVASRTRKPW